jgi:HAD superfamily hydrolase (TIGR01509 family)
MPPLRAVVFDVDGILSDTEPEGHRPAFNAAFAAHGLGCRWGPEEYGRLLLITGGRNRIAAYLRACGHPDADRLASAVHRTKTTLFRELVLSGRCPARPGVRRLVEDLVAEGVRIGVATTGSRAWVEPLVDAVLGRGTADVVVTGEDVARLKPDPEVYLRALRQLSVEPSEALAIEDSEPGLRSARAAGLVTIVVTSSYTRGHDFKGAAVVLEDFDAPHPLTQARCRTVHARWCARGRVGDGAA